MSCILSGDRLLQKRNKGGGDFISVLYVLFLSGPLLILLNWKLKGNLVFESITGYSST